jgi:hypothetical protein
MVIGQQSVGKEEIMPRQDAPLSGLTGARKPLSGDDLILLSQTISGNLKSTYGTLADLLQYLFTNNPSTDGAITSLGYLKQVTTGGLLEGNGKADHPLNVKISAGAGNLLQSRNDGLYYGIEAPADISVLYVDSLLGNDSNNGTSTATPFKTIDKALSLVTGTMVQTILLKCGDDRPTYVTRWGKGIAQAGQLYIKAYGDPYLDGDIRWQKETLLAPNDAFRVYHPPASVPIQRPRLATSYGTPSSIGVVTNGVFNVHDKAKLVFSNIDLRLRAIDPNNNPFILAWSGAIFYASKDAQIVLEYCYITDDRRYPEVADGGRNIMLNTPASGLGNSSLILTQSRLRVSSSGRAATDYRPIVGVLNSLHQVWQGGISSGFNIEAMADNIYPIMDQYGEGSVLNGTVRDTAGNVLLPNSDYTHFSHPQSEIVIPNGSVTEPKIAAGAVTNSKIANNAVTDDKIQSVSASKITGVIPSANLPPASATVNVVDNLSSNSVNDALSANQGRVLAGQLASKFNSTGGSITGPTTINSGTNSVSLSLDGSLQIGNQLLSRRNINSEPIFSIAETTLSGEIVFLTYGDQLIFNAKDYSYLDSEDGWLHHTANVGRGKYKFETNCNVFEFNRLVYMGDNTFNHAVNGYSYLPNGVLLQWGVIDYSATSFLGGSQTDERYILVNFPLVFPNAALNVQTCVVAPFLTRFTDWLPQTAQISSSQFYIILQNWGNASGLADKPKVQWMAIGY